MLRDSKKRKAEIVFFRPCAKAKVQEVESIFREIKPSEDHARVIVDEGVKNQSRPFVARLVFVALVLFLAADRAVVVRVERLGNGGVVVVEKVCRWSFERPIGAEVFFEQLTAHALLPEPTIIGDRRDKLRTEAKVPRGYPDHMVGGHIGLARKADHK